MAVLCRLSYSSLNLVDDSGCMRRPSLLLTLLLLAGASCGGSPAPASSPSASPPGPAASTTGPPVAFGRGTVSIETASGPVTFAVEVAETTEAHQRGLMGRRELASDAGMIFVFADEQNRRFWMKDTLIPLSIAYADSTGRIVSIVDMEPCTADPCPLYSSDAPAQFALEVNQGRFDELGVQVGDVITLVEV